MTKLEKKLLKSAKKLINDKKLINELINDDSTARFIILPFFSYDEPMVYDKLIFDRNTNKFTQLEYPLWVGKKIKFRSFSIPK